MFKELAWENQMLLAVSLEPTTFRWTALLTTALRGTSVITIRCSEKGSCSWDNALDWGRLAGEVAVARKVGDQNGFAGRVPYNPSWSCRCIDKVLRRGDCCVWPRAGEIIRNIPSPGEWSPSSSWLAGSLSRNKRSTFFPIRTRRATLRRWIGRMTGAVLFESVIGWALSWQRRTNRFEHDYESWG